MATRPPPPCVEYQCCRRQPATGMTGALMGAAAMAANKTLHVIV